MMDDERLKEILDQARKNQSVGNVFDRSKPQAQSRQERLQEIAAQLKKNATMRKLRSEDPEAWLTHMRAAAPKGRKYFKSLFLQSAEVRDFTSRCEGWLKGEWENADMLIVAETFCRRAENWETKLMYDVGEADVSLAVEVEREKKKARGRAAIVAKGIEELQAAGRLGSTDLAERQEILSRIPPELAPL